MSIQELKLVCNQKYAQAIEEMEQGGSQASVARLLLETAELLVRISKTDLTMRFESQEKAAKLLAAAKSLRSSGNVSSVYLALTGKQLIVASAGKGAVPMSKDEAPVSEDEAPMSVDEVSMSEDEVPMLEDKVPMSEDEAPMSACAKEDAVKPNLEEALAQALDGNASHSEGQEDVPPAGGGKEIKEHGKETEYRFMWDALPKISFDDVAGLDDVKEAVMRKVLLPLKNPSLYDGYVKKNGGGLLLYGPPGTGKTMIAAAIAHEIGAKFCSLGPSDLVMPGVGNSEKACVALFKEARSFSCSVLFFDEMESICPASTHAQGARQLRSELLRQMQGMEAYGEQTDRILFLIAATNKPWDIDPAFVRPGRFGTRIFVGLPDASARKYMIQMRLNKIMAAGKVHIDEIDIDLIVERTQGFNGADMANLLDEVQELSALRSVKTGVKVILQEDFDNALQKITTSVQEKDMKKLLEWKDQNG